MNLDKYTQKSQEAILAAQGLAQDYNHQSIEPIHILLALLMQDQGVVPAIVTKVAGSPLALRQELQNELDSRPKVSWPGSVKPTSTNPLAFVLWAMTSPSAPTVANWILAIS